MALSRTPTLRTRSSSWRRAPAPGARRAPAGRASGRPLGPLAPDRARRAAQQREHNIDGKKVEAKAAVPKNSGSSSALTRKMFVGGTVKPWPGMRPLAAVAGRLRLTEGAVQGEISDDDFRDYFLQYGEIEDSVVRAPACGPRPPRA